MYLRLPMITPVMFNTLIGSAWYKYKEKLESNKMLWHLLDILYSWFSASWIKFNNCPTRWDCIQKYNKLNTVASCWKINKFNGHFIVIWRSYAGILFRSSAMTLRHWRNPTATFRANIITPSSGIIKSKETWEILTLEDEWRTFLRNVGVRLSSREKSCLKRT